MVAGGGLFGERFIGMRIPAWHQLGIVKEEQISATEAFAEGGLTYKYHTLSIGATLPDGTFIDTSGQKMVFREPTEDDPEWRNLGVVSDGYSYLQNDALASGIDAIAKKTGWTFETAGALGKGETVFVCLRTGKHSIYGDEVDSFFLVSDGKAANRALTISSTLERAVCTNTLKVAEESASLQITIPHTVEVGEEYKVWLDHISDLQAAQEGTLSDLRLMGSVKIDDDIARQIFEAAFPPPNANPRVRMSQKVKGMEAVPDDIKENVNGSLARHVEAYEYNLRQSEKWQAGAFSLYQRFNAGAEQGGKMSFAALETLRQTPYAALQAVTELCDWGGTDRKSVASSALFGTRASQKASAWSSALRIAKAELN